MLAYSTPREKKTNENEEDPQTNNKNPERKFFLDA
jgi:hypothetical protein